MPLSSDPLSILLAHDAWATRLILNSCRPLTRDQFHQRFEIGLGSLHDTLTHIISAMRRWTDRFEERPIRPALQAIPQRPDIACDAAERSVEQLLELHDQAARDFSSAAARWRARAPDSAGLGSSLSLDYPGDDGRMRTYTFSRAAVLVHVCTHGVHHRAQCLNMLRRLNLPGISDKLPDPSAVDWQAETESPSVVKP